VRRIHEPKIGNSLTIQHGSTTTNKQPWTYLGSFTTFLGGKTICIGGLDTADAERSQWYSRVAEFVARVSEYPEFKIKDNGCRRFPGVLVNQGIEANFRGRPFEIWSDQAGEIILLQVSMGHRGARELVERLGMIWNEKDNQ